MAPKLASKKALDLFFTPRKHAPKPWELTAVKSSKTVILKGGIHCMVWGEGKPVLLMHGWEGRASQMSVFLPYLADKYQLIAINAPTHGDSKGTRSNPHKFVDAIFEAQKRFGDLYAIIGHSMGGGAAVYAAIENLSVEKVVSIAGPSNFENVVRAFASFIGLRSKAFSFFLKQAETEVQLDYSTIDLATRIKTFDKPVLIIHDEDDMEVPFTEGHRYKSALVNGGFFATQGLGHRKIMQSEIVLNKVTTFLS